MKLIYLLLLSSLLSSCTTTIFVVSPNYQLVSDLTDNDNLNTYSDSLIEITFRPYTTFYGCTLVNKTDEPMYINWEETSFANNDLAGPVINKDVDFYDKGQAVKPTLIPPRMTRVDKIIPVENIVIDEYGARLKEIETSKTTESEEKAKRLANSSSTQGVYLTLYTSSGPIAYRFNFANIAKIEAFVQPVSTREIGVIFRVLAIVFMGFTTLEQVI